VISVLHQIALRAACPVAPSPQVQQHVDDIRGWAQWAVISILAISFMASVGMLVWGRVTHHPKGARLGTDGLMICVVGAILYVAGYGVITGITGCS
jgi:hypothetical protein